MKKMGLVHLLVRIPLFFFFYHCFQAAKIEGEDTTQFDAMKLKDPQFYTLWKANWVLSMMEWVLFGLLT